MSNNKFKVLVVEDEANICSFIETLLETNGYQALVANTCAMGQTLFTSHNPDLIILDLGLPDRDGLELIRFVRQKFLTPIVVLSARTTEQDKIEALDLGANDYITKPFGTGELLARVRAAQLFYTLSGDDPFRLYTLLVFVSVGLSAFIDNIPYVATMLPVVQGIAGLMNGGAGFPPELFYFGLLTGATLGGNLTPIGASANIAAIGILRKQGEQVRTRDFLRIGIPFTLAAVLTGYVYLWLVWGA